MNSRRRIGHASSRFSSTLSWPRMHGNGAIPQIAPITAAAVSTRPEVARSTAYVCGSLTQVNNWATLVSAIEASSSMPATKLDGGN
jgi:hypothetical protein